MKYRVEIAPEAVPEAEQDYLWIREHSPVSAAKWFNGLVEAVESLENQPTRCALAPENDAFEEEIRQLLYGKRGGVYRVLFSIAGGTVRVLHIRHGARRLLEP